VYLTCSAVQWVPLQRTASIGDHTSSALAPWWCQTMAVQVSCRVAVVHHSVVVGTENQLPLRGQGVRQ
jgi:hypothetical protein